MKRKIMFFLYGMIIAVVFAENNVKLPKTDKVNIEIINTVERNKENEQIYDEVYYPRLSKNKILVNGIRFYNGRGDLLHSIDMMEIYDIKCNDESNIFLCTQYENKFQVNQIEYLYLFDFKNGKQELIDKNIHNYLLSSDGKKVYYIHRFEYKTNSEINLNMWTKGKYKKNIINYKRFTNEVCSGFKLKEIDGDLTIYLYQDALVMAKLFIDKNLNVVNYSTPKYDEDKRMSYLINPDGTIEYLSK